MSSPVLLFDLDETLIADLRATELALTRAGALAYERCAIEPAALTGAVRRHAHLLWEGAPTYPYCHAIGISSWEGLWGTFAGADPGLQQLAAWAPHYQLEVWKRALAEFDGADPELAQPLMTRFHAHRRATFLTFDETVPALQRLRGQHRLAIVTNGAPDVQRTKIAGTQLAPYFDAIVVSGEVGVGKPDARVFDAALAQLDVEVHEAIMIGDNIVRDIWGAQQMGMRAIWVNRTHAAPVASGITPDATIATLDDLDAYLRA